MEFTYESYAKLIKYLRDNNYIITNYHEYSIFEKPAILRHDVGLSIDKALEMARLENKINVSSTYFFLLSTNFYNIASKDSLLKINQIREMGHEIGLHFDETKYDDIIQSDGDIYPYLQDELKVMEMILKIPITVVSMHRPSKFTLDAAYDFGDIVNSYSHTFFREFKYVSDSRRHWREDIFEIINSDQYNKLHILIHPFWYNKKELTIKESILQYINAANWERYLNVRDNVRDCDEIVQESEVIK